MRGRGRPKIKLHMDNRCINWVKRISPFSRMLGLALKVHLLPVGHPSAVSTWWEVGTSQTTASYGKRWHIISALGLRKLISIRKFQ